MFKMPAVICRHLCVRGESSWRFGMNTERIFSAIENDRKKYEGIESKLGLSNNGLLSK